MEPSLLKDLSDLNSLTEEYSWKYARSQLPMNRQAQAREEGMRVVTRNTLNTSDSYRVTVSAEELNHVDMQHAISEEYLVFKMNGEKSHFLL